MKRILVSIFLLGFLSPCALAQLQFVKIYGGGSYDVGKSVVQTDDDGYVIAGSTGSFDLDNGQFMLIRTDAWGSEQWRKYYGGDFSDNLESMVATVDGGYIMAGVSETLGASYQVLLVKTDLLGDTMWTRHYGGPSWDYGHQIITMSSGGYAVVGQTYSFGQGQGDVLILRLDEAGDVLWMKTYGSPAQEAGHSIDETMDGGLIVAGYTEGFGGGGKDAWVLRLDALGDSLWTRAFGGEEDDVANAIVATSDGGFAFSGGRTSNGVGGFDFNVTKMNDQGLELWSFLYGGPLNDVWNDIIEQDGGRLATIGYSQTTTAGGGGDDLFILRSTHDGLYDESRTYGELGDERGHSIITTSDGGYLLLGETTGYLDRMTDAIAYKTGPNGEGVVFTVGIQESTIGEELSIAVAPNPFSEYAYFTLRGYRASASKWRSAVELHLYDMFGKQVHTQLIENEVTPLLLSQLADGVYSYRVSSSGAFSLSGTLVKMGN